MTSELYSLLEYTFWYENLITDLYLTPLYDPAHLFLLLLFWIVLLVIFSTSIAPQKRLTNYQIVYFPLSCILFIFISIVSPSKYIPAHGMKDFEEQLKTFEYSQNIFDLERSSSWKIRVPYNLAVFIDGVPLGSYEETEIEVSSYGVREIILIWTWEKLENWPALSKSCLDRYISDEIEVPQCSKEYEDYLNFYISWGIEDENVPYKNQKRLETYFKSKAKTIN